MAFDVSAIGRPLDQRYPAEIATQVMQALQAARPDWIPRNASPEMVFIEAVALAVADLANAGNGVVAAVEEDILSRFFQVARRPGAAAVGQITVTFDSTVTTVIPAGTGFLLVDYRVEVATTADVTVTVASSAVLQVATTTSTTLVNGVGAGAALDVLDVIPNVLSVAVTTGFSGGADPEDDAAYTARARERLARVTNSLVVSDHFTAYVLEDGRASNALCIPAWNGAAVGTIGTDTGHVTVVTYGFGANLSAGVRTELVDAMQAITYAGATVHVNAAATTSVPVTVTVKALAGFTSTEVQAGVTAAINAFLDPQTWPIGDDVVPGALSAAINDVASVDYVVSLAAPASTVTIADDAVPTPGTISVSVT